MSKTNTDHVVFSSLTQAFECTHCKASHQPELPMPIERFVSVGKGFTLMHKLCQPKAAPDRQLSLPSTTSAPAPVTKVAKTWLQLWDALKEALAPHEYMACKEWTPFVRQIGGAEDFAEVAAWAAFEVSEAQEGASMPRPKVLADAIYSAVADAQERHAKAAASAPAKPKRKRTRKEPA